MNNLTWHQTVLTQSLRSEQKSQKPCVIWFTGLSGSGKSTIANQVEQKLFQLGQHSYLLDGDNIRHGLNADLGFSAEDRVENIRRVGEVSKLFCDAGLIVLSAFISPYEADRAMVRNLMNSGEFIEVFIDTPIEECERRDPKNLYQKARAGEIKDFTGIDSPYEAPKKPEIILKTQHLTPNQAASKVIDYLMVNGNLMP
ncbi:adenylyl-sulfate kinase [Thiomicrorhabdus indica]|uniref:adenylyl-sulfate kinase n=1 Tax=Thiomicrorhabdus indica TaxID=2267253 RepID=UPI002AA85104|nr:adenylyl-sulfate kinase [Thiomicrorhabdus indica]